MYVYIWTNLILLRYTRKTLLLATLACKQTDKTSKVEHVGIEGMTLNVRLPINTPATCIAESAQNMEFDT